MGFSIRRKLQMLSHQDIQNLPVLKSQPINLLCPTVARAGQSLHELFSFLGRIACMATTGY